MKGERVQARWARLQSQAPVSGEGIQAWPRDPVQGFQLTRLHLEARLEAVTQVSFTGFPLPLPGCWVTAVQGRDIVTQEPRVHCPQGHVEWMVAISRRHDVGPGVFTEGAQGWSVGTQVGGHCSHSTARLKWRAMRHWAERWALHWSTALLSQLLWDTRRSGVKKAGWKEVAGPGPQLLMSQY